MFLVLALEPRASWLTVYLSRGFSGNIHGEVQAVRQAKDFDGAESSAADPETGING